MDTQAGYSKSKPKQEIAEMSLGMDDRYPKELSMDEMKAIKSLPQIKEIESEVCAYRQGLEEQYRRKAPKDKQAILQRLINKRNARIQRNARKLLEEKRVKYFRNISNLEIKAQLLPLSAGKDLPSNNMDKRTVPEMISELFDKGSFNELLLAILDLFE